MFKFIHAADIHLDSPLRGLDRCLDAPVEAIRTATRGALENLVLLALDEKVAFLLIAGDLYDGDWKDFRTGLFFTEQMARLREAKIPVYLISGNHDAANRMTKALRLPDNVRMLASEKPETVRITAVDTELHGQGFANAAVIADLSAGYPMGKPGCFHIGLLHTCATGREGHHNYAPCTVEGLRSKGYHYWALGHIHKQEILCRDPWIVFSGNIQGRHVRETGAKGCLLVTVGEDQSVRVEPKTLDVLRWEECRVDASDSETGYDIQDKFGEQLERLLLSAEDRPLALRVIVAGTSPAHEMVAAEPQRWINEIKSRAADIGLGQVWVEKVRFQTSPPRDLDPARFADGPLGELVQLIAELQTDENQLVELGKEFVDLKKKLPAQLKEGPFALNLKSPEALRELLDQVRGVLIGRLHSDDQTA